MAQADYQLADRIADRDARERGSRLRVCRGCVVPTDHVFGTVHSEMACNRCAKEPCFGFIIEERDAAGRTLPSKSPGNVHSVRGGRAAHRCGSCQGYGHNSRTCPMKH